MNPPAFHEGSPTHTSPFALEHHQPLVAPELHRRWERGTQEEETLK